MSQIELVIDSDNNPVNLPSPMEIVQQSRDAARARSRAPDSGSNNLSGVPLVDKSSGAAYVWVKYGRSITLDEALTQNFVAQAINGDADAAVRIPCVYLAFRSGQLRLHRHGVRRRIHMRRFRRQAGRRRRAVPHRHPGTDPKARTCGLRPDLAPLFRRMEFLPDLRFCPRAGTTCERGKRSSSSGLLPLPPSLVSG